MESGIARKVAKSSTLAKGTKMSTRLAEIKYYFEQGGAIQAEDARWLIAELERLQSIEDDYKALHTRVDKIEHGVDALREMYAQIRTAP